MFVCQIKFLNKNFFGNFWKIFFYENQKQKIEKQKSTKIENFCTPVMYTTGTKQGPA